MSIWRKKSVLGLVTLAALLPFQNCNNTEFSAEQSSGSHQSPGDNSGAEYGLSGPEAAAPNCYSYAEAGSSKPGGAASLPCTSLPKTRILSRLDAFGNIVVRVIFPRAFSDNSYGANAIGWGTRGHTFKDLVGSDHVIVTLYDKADAVALVVKLDYISESAGLYKTLGVDGGEGKLLAGSRADVVAVKTSLDVNLNELGYNLTVDSPASDSNYSPNASYPNWIFDVWYEVTVKPSAFAAGYGRASLDGIHASPSKIGQNTCPVVPAVCE